MDKAAIYSFMAGQRYGVISSVAEDGSPQFALVATTPELEVVFDTVRSSRKYANLKRAMPCSMVVGLGGSAHEVTVQLEGLAREPSPEELHRYLSVYFAAWPDGLERLKSPVIAHFVVQPTWVRCSDFSKIPPEMEVFKTEGLS